MSLERVGHEPRPLLPDALEERLVAGLLKVAGFALAGSALAGWLSLVTWSAEDPSLTHATSGLTHNWLGPLGAIVSDLLLQTLGFVGILVYLGAAFWGGELILKQRIAGLKLRLWLFPLAIVTLAGAFGSLPAPPSWPLNHGLGGLAGDTTFKVLAGVLAMINPARAGMVTGLIMFTAGMCLLSAGLGLTQRDWTVLWKRDPGGSGGKVVTRWLAERVRGTPKVAVAADSKAASAGADWSGEEALAEDLPASAHVAPSDGTASHKSGAARATAPEPLDGTLDEPLPAFVRQGQARHDPTPVRLSDIQSIKDWQSVPAAACASDRPGAGELSPAAVAAVARVHAPPQAFPAPAKPALRPQSAAVGRSAGPQIAAAPAGEPVARGDGFDTFTDRASHAMAARFAPPPAQPTPVRSTGAQTNGAQSTGAQTNGAVDSQSGLMPTAAARAGSMLASLFRADEPNYRRPSLNILRRPAAQRPSAEFTPPVLRGSARLLEDVLADFSVKGEVKDIRPGPVVTLFEFEPARGTKSSRVVALADDIARSMSATSARVGIVPGRNVLGIELPNVRREMVLLRDVIESEAWRRTDAQLPIVLGKGIGGEPVIADLARMPHLLVAGTTGSGKSVAVNAMILSLLFRHTPADCRLLLIDPKMLELSVYNGIPHLLAPVVTDPHQAAAALNWAVNEMDERYKRMAQLGVRNIESYNNRVHNARKRGETVGRTVQTGFDERTGLPIYEREPMNLEPMPFIVIVVDEFADLMVVAGKEIEGSVQRLAQMARAAGIHLIMATQRPSVDVVTGTIKANFPTRIAFKVASKIDSRTILNEPGAEQLLGAGDMLYASGAGQIIRVHGPLVSDEEVERVAEALRENGPPHYMDMLLRTPEPAASMGLSAASTPSDAKAQASEDADDLFDRAVAIIHRDQKASTSYLQRRLSVGYNRAADLIERMEREGLISQADAVGRRRVLLGQPDLGFVSTPHQPEQA